ncbi:MAG: DsbA family protein [Atopobiaceae bacterium]|nr:DsbA family protein [Atopobiaceae bacterium]
MSKVLVTHFTDPMMGLSWEMEPALRAIEVRFGSQVEVRPAMGLLMQDVSDFMTPEERSLPEAEGLTRYNARLARIYLQEEPIAGMPINMEGFALFAPDRRTSLPLCLAYEAVAALRPKLAATFLYRLRYATVVECRPTTKLEELVRVAKLCDMGEGEFLDTYRSSEAQNHLYRDLALKEQLGIYGLPALLVSSGDQAAFLPGVPSYQQLEQAVAQVSNGAVSHIRQAPRPTCYARCSHPIRSSLPWRSQPRLTSRAAMRRLHWQSRSSTRERPASTQLQRVCS